MINSITLPQPASNPISGYLALAAMRANPKLKMGFFLTEEDDNFYCYWYEKHYPVILLGIFGNVQDALSCGESKLYAVRNRWSNEKRDRA